MQTTIIYIIGESRKIYIYSFIEARNYRNDTYEYTLEMTDTNSHIILVSIDFCRFTILKKNYLHSH